MSFLRINILIFALMSIALILGGCNNSIDVGVNEDIELKIHNKYPDNLKVQKVLINFAKELEKILIVENLEQINLNEYLISVDCISRESDNSFDDIGYVENLVFNTDQKKKKYEKFNQSQSGKFFGNEYEEELNCDF